MLFTKVMKFDPKTPDWSDRDRFVPSAGHGSMLLYASRCTCLATKTPARSGREFPPARLQDRRPPEHGFLKGGIETTTGPLGQGVANAVGMAVAEAKLAAEFGSDVVDHHTWCWRAMAADGGHLRRKRSLLAGHLNLNKLTIIWDNNGITIDGKVSNADSTDQLKRFEASGWNTVSIDGHDQAAIEGAERCAQVDPSAADRGQDHHRLRRAQKQGTEKVHGSPLGAEELSAAKAALGITYPAFPSRPRRSMPGAPPARGRPMRWVPGRGGRGTSMWPSASSSSVAFRRPAGGLCRGDRWLQAEARGRQAEGSDAQGEPDGARSDQRRCAERRSAARPTSPART